MVIKNDSQLGMLQEKNNNIIGIIDQPEVTQSISNQLILTTLNDLYNWARLSSLWQIGRAHV